MKKSIELRQKCSELLEQSKRIVDTVMGQKRSPNAEEQRVLDDLTIQAPLLEAQIYAAEREESSELRAVGGRPGNGPIGLQFDRDSQIEVRDTWNPNLRGSAEYRKAFHDYLAYGKNLPNESADLLQKEARALGTTIGSGGGYLVPEGFQSELERALKSFGGMRAVARILTTTSGNDLPWPTVNDTTNTGAILSEGSQAGAQDSAFGQVTLKAYEFTSGSIPVALQLIEDSGINLEPILASLLGERIARIQNTYFTTGDDNNKPQGVVTGATLGKLGTTGQQTTVIYQDLLDLVHSVDPAYRTGSSWMFNDTTLASIMGLKDSYGHYYFQPDATSAEAQTILGYPYTVNQDVASMASTANSILFGNFQKYLIREVNGISVVRLDQPLAKYRQVEFIAFARADGRVIDAGTHPIKYYKNTT